jgi:hypothetical protein
VRQNERLARRQRCLRVSGSARDSHPFEEDSSPLPEKKEDSSPLPEKKKEMEAAQAEVLYGFCQVPQTLLPHTAANR